MQVAYPSVVPKERAYRENRRQWLALWVEEAGGPKRFAEVTDTVDTHITAILKGRRNVGDDLAEKVERKLGKTEGLMDWPAPGAPQLDGPGSEYLPGFEQFSVPKLENAGSMGGGSDQLPDDIVVGRLTLSPQWIANTLKPLTKPQNLRFIHGYGDSMEPTFSDGDILLVDAGVHLCDVDGIYVLATNDRLFIKRVTQRFDGVHEITSDNPKVKTVQALDGSQQVDVLGRVVWAWNGKKL